jgi:hypothetical protein
MLQDTGQKPSVISQTAELAAKTQRWLRMGIDVPLIWRSSPCFSSDCLWSILPVGNSPFNWAAGSVYVHSSDRLGNSGYLLTGVT